MATYLNPDISKEGILAVGDNVLYTCPYKYRATLSAFKFNNPAAYNISLRIERADPIATITYYNFTLDAGDFMQDGGGYILNYGDQIIVNVDTADTVYSYFGQVVPINVSRQP